MLFTTQRLGIRLLTGQDLEHYHQLISHPNNLTFEPLEPIPISETHHDLTHWLDRNLEFNGEVGTTVYGIELTAEQRLIGYISSLFLDTDSSILEIGICIDHLYTNCGYGYEALSCYLPYAFLNTSIHKVVASTDNRNVACIRLLEKCSMTREGLLRKQVKMLDGKYYDEAFYGLLRDEILPSLGT